MKAKGPWDWENLNVVFGEYRSDAAYTQGIGTSDTFRPYANNGPTATVAEQKHLRKMWKKGAVIEAQGFHTASTHYQWGPVENPKWDFMNNWYRIKYQPKKLFCRWFGCQGPRKTLGYIFRRNGDLRIMEWRCSRCGHPCRKEETVS